MWRGKAFSTSLEPTTTGRGALVRGVEGAVPPLSALPAVDDESGVELDSELADETILTSSSEPSDTSSSSRILRGRPRFLALAELLLPKA